MTASTSKCRQCGREIFWHKSKAGKNYPCNSEDRKDFHQCQTSAAPATAPATKAAPQSLETTTDERLEALESTVAALARQVKQLGSRLPITDADIPW
jgi:hypothetical protein